MLAMAVCAQVATRRVGDTKYVPFRIISKTSCKLHAVLGYNSGPAQYVMVFDKTNTPTNGQVGSFSFPVGAQQYFVLDFGAYGADLDAVLVANSSTPDTNTIALTNCAFQGVISGQNQ